MLKKKNRLTRKEFDLVFKKGKKSFSTNFLFIKLSETDDIKISVSISKKVYKKAVQRVKARRLIYKILKEDFENIIFEKKYRGIILITKKILELKKDDLKKEIEKLLRRG